MIAIRFIAPCPAAVRATWYTHAAPRSTGNQAQCKAIAVNSQLLAVSLVGGTWPALSEARHARIEQRRVETRLSQMVELANHALFDVHGSIKRLWFSLGMRFKTCLQESRQMPCSTKASGLGSRAAMQRR